MKKPMCRREFLAVAGAAALTVVVGGCAGGGGSSSSTGAAGGTVPTPAPRPQSNADLAAIHFHLLVGETFFAINEQGLGGALTLHELVDYTEMAEYPDDKNFRDPFVLVFTGDPGTLPGEGDYTVSHPEVGDFKLHVIPRFPGPDGRARYEVTLT